MMRKLVLLVLAYALLTPASAEDVEESPLIQDRVREFSIGFADLLMTRQVERSSCS